MKKILAHLLVSIVVVSSVFSQALPVQKNTKLYKGMDSARLSQKRTLSVAGNSISKSIVNPYVGFSNKLKGEVGEYIVSKTLLRTSVDGRQKWTLISPRNAPQGLDHIAIRWKNGRPIQPMVAETKVNSSRLGMTNSGPQMSDGWIAPRLKGWSWGYNSAGNANQISINAEIPNKKSIVCDTHISDGKGGYEKLWSIDNGKTWNYTGKPSDIELAKKQCRQVAQVLDASVDGKISIRKLLFRVDLNNRKVYQSRLDSNGSILSTKELTNISQEEFSSIIEERILLESNTGKYIVNKKIAKKSVSRLHGTYKTLTGVGKSALIAAGINTVMQVAINRGFDNFSFASVGMAAGYGVAAHIGAYGIERLASFTAKHATRKLVKNVATSLVKSAHGVALVIDVSLAIAGYKLGWYDKKELAIQIGTAVIRFGLVIAGAKIGGSLGGAIGAAIGIAITLVATPIINKIIYNRDVKKSTEFLRNFCDTGSLEYQEVERKYFSGNAA